ncbi:MAG TPA: type III-A CRISPR-associated protein Csm2 [Bacteroidia bacterium]|nr:type III-A CRISPR-associated protein Csm2 [Bacteroidia bacterium]HRS58455.1 type III-A CRISPR-associated protein Csm2 [Bacteroidia bacterium]
MKEYLAEGDPAPHLKPEWIKKGITNDALEWAMGFAHFLAISNRQRDERDHLMEMGNFKYKKDKPVFRKELSTSQLRKFFGEMKRLQIQEFDDKNLWLANFRMIKPKLAYAVGRETSPNPKIIDFYHELEIGINAVETKEHFQNFVQIVEAIVAYHKFFEKNKKAEENEQD